MKGIISKIIVKIPLYRPLMGWVGRKKQIRSWQKNGRPIPPPHIVKQEVLKTYAKRYCVKILVETGTYHGRMVEAMKDRFEGIYSIELDPDLCQKAKQKFELFKHIEIIQGDSSKELGTLIEKLKGPALFWLDGHYSAGDTARGEKDTPISEELEHILTCKENRHVIIIDDARCFGADPAYPTLDGLKEFMLSKRNDLEMTISDDIIRMVPKT